MKILIYSINFAPENIGIAKYNTELAEYLAAQNHNVKVITAAPYYPNWRVFSGYQAYKYRTEIVNQLHITHCPLWIPKNPTALKRIFHLLSFAASSFLALMKILPWKADYIFFVEPTFFTCPGALLYSKLTRAKTHLHIQDLEIAVAYNLNLCRNTFLHKFFTKFEHWVYQRCDTISTISPKMGAQIAAKGIDNNKILFLPNWVDTQTIKPDPALGLQYRRQLRLSLEKIICLYSGNLGAKQGLEIIINSANRLKNNSKYLFIICGNGAYRSSLQNLTQELHLANILWLDLQPTSQLNALLNCADIHLLPQKAAVANDVLPSKLTGMLASGKPIIATALAGTAIYELVQDCGLVVSPDDDASFAAAVETLAANPTLRNKLGVVGRKLAEKNFAQKNILAKFARTFTAG